MFGLIAMMIILGSPALAATSPGFSDFTIVSTIYEPYPAEPGQYIDLYIKVENRGTKPAADTAFELLPKYPFSIESSQDVLKSYGLLTRFSRFCSNTGCAWMKTQSQATIRLTQIPHRIQRRMVYSDFRYLR